MAGFFPLENLPPPRPRSALVDEEEVDTKLGRVQETLQKVEINVKGPRFGDAHAHFRGEADLDEAAKAFYEKAGTC